MDGILWNWPYEVKEGLSFFFFFFIQYLPLSWLGRVIRWQLFNFELHDTSIVIKEKEMQENADKLWESDLLWLTLCNFIFLFTNFVHFEKEIIKQVLLLLNSASSNFVSWAVEKDIFHAYYMYKCQCKTQFPLMGRRTRYVSRDPPLKWVVMLQGFKNEVYFSYTVLHISV